jgi:predicted Zn-dependent peptidase
MVRSAKEVLLLLMGCLAAIGLPAPAGAVDFAALPPDKLYFPALTFDLPEARRLTLENGMVIYFAEDHERPVVNIRALVKTGTVHDPEGKEGVAELTGEVMRIGGTEKTNSEDMDSRLDFLAARAAISMTRDACQVHFSVMSQDLGEGLNLLSQILIRPIFEQKKFDLALELKKEDIRRLKDNPQRLAFREFNRLLYRNGPWGRFTSAKSLENIERADLVRFHSRYFKPNNIIFAVSGDVTKAQLIEKFNQYFSAWQKDDAVIGLPKPEQKTAPGIYSLHKDIPQSVIISGQFAPSKTDPDHYATAVLDFIAGSGGFASRIVGAVRNNAGLAYSAGSYYRARQDFGVLGAYAFTNTASTMKAIGLMNSVFDDIRTGGIMEAELDWAKKSINNGFIFSFTTPEQTLWQQIHLEYENLPPDFLINYRGQIDSVNLINLNRIATLHLGRDKNVVLILGDSKKLDAPADEKDKPIMITLPD